MLELIFRILSRTGGIPGTVKAVHRGHYTGTGGNVTIPAVNYPKAEVRSWSKGSAGSARVTGGTISVPALTIGGVTATGSVTFPWVSSAPSVQGISTGLTYSVNGTQSMTIPSTGIAAHTSTINPSGATDLTVKEYSAYLNSATVLYCDGPCDWEVTDYF